MIGQFPFDKWKIQKYEEAKLEKQSEWIIIIYVVFLVSFDTFYNM